MRRTLIALLAPLAALALFADGCSSSEDAAAPSSSDGGRGEAGSADRATVGTDDAGATTVDDAATSTTVCAPQSIASYKPSWTPPAALHQGKCSGAQIAAFTDCAYGHPGYDTAKCDAWNKDAANSACIACAAPGATAAQTGAMLPVAGSTNANYAGCVAALTGDVSATGCGAKIQAAEQCRMTSCQSACPVTPGDDAAFKAFTKCLDDAWTGECATYAAATTCADDFRKGSGAAAACYPNTTDFGVIVSTYVTLFCGGVGDAGSDAAHD